MSKITEKQEEFCQRWVDSFGNGTLAALETYDIENKEFFNTEPPEAPEDRKEWKKSVDKMKEGAINKANEVMRDLGVLKRIDELMDERGLTEMAVKRSMFKLMNDKDPAIRLDATVKLLKQYQ